MKYRLINQYKKSSFILSFIVFILFLGNVELIGQNNTPDQARPVVKLMADTPVLYHASFKILKYHFTGLIALKYLKDKKESRVVFLSEAGLNIAEFAMVDNKVHFVKSIPVLERRSAKKYLSRVVYMMLAQPNCKIKEKDDSVFVCKGKNGKFYYTFQNDILVQLKFKKGLKYSSMGYFNPNGATNQIAILKRKKKTVEINLVENAFK